MRTLMANTYFITRPEALGKPWILIDAGLPGYGATIERAAAFHFGARRPPAAIVLTHGHFDHVGALCHLAGVWGVPVYAHPLEFAFLTGGRSYPPPDPRAGGGALSWLSPLYPRGPIDLGTALRPLPPDGRLPLLPEWQWLHTPGHSPGHVSFFRQRDRILIAGDAVVTVRQESLFAVLAQRRQVHRPPGYYTIDWTAAAASVQALDGLAPTVLAAGHGSPMYGRSMRDELRYLATHFQRLAVPPHGRYTTSPIRSIDDHVRTAEAQAPM
jgi:glyoxylase-like metal-dependent hydrolase (beta-lactamase superfamily II)